VLIYFEFEKKVVNMKSFLKEEDPEIYRLIKKEEKRQEDHLELIASENYVSPAVREATGSVLTNKYAEGYPGKRYYGGCEVIDEVENLAIERLKQLFHCEHANVQGHSGSNVNFAVYLALLKPGDTFMGQNLSDGGHLTHGAKVNFSGKIFKSVCYGVDENGFLDYDKILELALQAKPKLIMTGASAYPRQIDFKKFKEIADKVGAYLVADISHIAGLVATGLHPSPFPYADVVTTTTHKTLRGPRGGVIMCKEEFAKKIDKAIFPTLQGGPLEHIICAKAVAFGEALKPEFKVYQEQILKNAKALSGRLMQDGIKLVSNGTDNHLMLIDLSNENLTGKDLELLLDKANISTNKNTIPNEKRLASVTSGLRIGTPAVTTRGMKEKEMKIIADIIADIIKNGEKVVDLSREKVKALCAQFPLK
jgi:glycine hydroxymethyltransferase